MKPKTELFTVKNMSVTAMLAAAATVIYQILELPLNPFAPFLKVNFADIPAILAGLIISPVSGIVVTFLRCFIHLFRTSTYGIGEAADFLVGSAIVIAFCLTQNIFRKRMNFNALKANILSVSLTFGATVIVGFFVNLILYPIYSNLIGKPVQSASALFIYLGATVITNAERTVMNVGLFLFLLPFVPRFRKMMNNG